MAASPTPSEVLELLGRGVDQRSIVRQLVETGFWSEEGAKNIVAFLANGMVSTPSARASARERAS
jgi:hypothetical protein